MSRTLCILFASALVLTTTSAIADPTGSLDKEDIRKVIREHRGMIADCYDAALAEDANVAGRLVMAFTIAPDGGVSLAEVVESDLGAPVLDACIMDAAMSWSFPEPRGGGVVTVRYPFVFSTAP